MTKNEKRRLLEAEMKRHSDEKKPFPWKWAILGAVITLCFAALLIYFIFFFRKPFSEIPPTEAENEVVMYIGEAPVTRDLYDYFYKNHERTTSTEGLTPEEKHTLLSEKTRRDLSELYASFEVGRDYDVTLETKEVAEMYERLLFLTRYGGEEFGYTLTGFRDLASYKKHLSDNFMTDRVYRLTMQQASVEYYTASRFTDTKKNTEKSEILSFFRNPYEARRMTFCAIFYSNFAGLGTEAQIKEATREQAQAAYRVLKNAENNADFVNTAIQYSPSVAPKTIENGMYLGLYDSDSRFSAVVDALFDMEVGDVSPIIETAEGFFIIRRLGNSEDYLTNEDNFATLRNSYLSNQFYKLIYEEGKTLYGKIVLPDEDDT